MIHFYKLTIRYRGQNFQGWQIQPSGKTLQGELNKVLKKIVKSEDVTSLASGRTDAGVHAQGQVVRVTIPFHMETKNLLMAINSLIDPALKVVDVVKVSDIFHPIRDAIKKEYRYFFMTNPRESLFSRDFVTLFKYELDLNLMNEAAKLFVGEYDFFNFHTVGSDPNSTIREVLEVEIIKSKLSTEIPMFAGEVFCLRIQGKGFLKQMVRAIMGAIVAVGRGHKSLTDLQMALDRTSDFRIGAVAPAEGLHLWQVWY